MIAVASATCRLIRQESRICPDLDQENNLAAGISDSAGVTNPLSMKEMAHLVNGPCKRQPGALASRESGALVPNPRAVTSRQCLDIHIKSTCLQDLSVALLVELQGKRAFSQVQHQRGKPVLRTKPEAYLIVKLLHKCSTREETCAQN